MSDVDECHEECEPDSSSIESSIETIVPKDNTVALEPFIKRKDLLKRRLTEIEQRKMIHKKHHINLRRLSDTLDATSAVSSSVSVSSLIVLFVLAGSLPANIIAMAFGSTSSLIQTFKRAYQLETKIALHLSSYRQYANLLSKTLTRVVRNH
eukprot:Lithocolla_globosa_v1_NODE_372_length_4260_cov_144.514388.p2 type:complete len:152 gc:universal NODE_372_length_4260_cov_144.514388:1334-879(-)